ncbi:MAG: metal ABC transporter permease [Thermoguttaceae bacterium]|nr:metal ABC transporter permease [Thermoguttaceae bacterium]MBR5244277.1 metal ABC transporter permease [Thermoguttaceae bacterium]
MTPDFLKNVYLLSAISSVTFGLIGALVVARRIGYLAGAISHCAFGGIGFGLWFQQALKTGALGTLALAACFASPERAPQLCERWSSFVNPIPTALLFAVLSALLVDAIRRRAKEREETLLGAIWAIGMALGLLFIERVDGYVSVSTYLFGDVLLIGRSDIWTATALGAAILLVVFCDFKRLEAVCFDEEYAELRGVNVDFQNRLLLTLAAIAVVLMLRIVGMAMIVALLTLPAATAGRFTKRLGTTIIASIAICFVGSWLGIWLSFLLNFSTGPTIILVVAIFYGISLLFGKK